jgi:hypothetical protein
VLLSPDRRNGERLDDRIETSASAAALITQLAETVVTPALALASPLLHRWLLRKNWKSSTQCRGDVASIECRLQYCNCAHLRVRFGSDLSTGTTLIFETELASTVAVVVSVTAPTVAFMSALPRPRPAERPVEVPAIRGLTGPGCGDGDVLLCAVVKSSCGHKLLRRGERQVEIRRRYG